MDQVDKRTEQANEFMIKKRRYVSKKVYTYKELMTTEFPPNKWSVDRLIPAEGLTILSAPPGSYKTWLLAHIVMSVASGSPVFGTFKTIQMNALMIDEENSARLLQERILALQDIDDLPIEFMLNTEFKTDKDSINKLIVHCRDHNIRLITFDSLIRIHDGNENDAKEMSKVFQVLKKLTSAGITVLITHHNRKSSGGAINGQEMRGSSDILAALDCHLALSRSDNRIKLTQTKVRFTEELPPLDIEFRSEDNTASFIFDGKLEPQITRTEQIKLVVLEVLKNGGLSQNSILNRLKLQGAGAGVNTLRLVLLSMEKDGSILSSPGSHNSNVYTLTD